MHPHAPLDADGSFRVLRRRFRRARWLVLLAAMVIYAILHEADQRIMDQFSVGLDIRIVEWSEAALIGVGCTFGLSRWEDQLVAHSQALETRRVATEQALLQLEAVQATARTVAHTINQPLAIIRGVTELYRATPPDERDDADLATILAQVDRAAGLVRQILAISRYRTIPYPGGAPMLDLSSPSQ